LLAKTSQLILTVSFSALADGTSVGVEV